MDQMIDDIRTLTEKTKKKILQDNPKLKYCGKCPFLMVVPAYCEYWDCPEKHVNNATINHKQKNTCLLMKSPTLWLIDKKGVYQKIVREYPVAWLDNGNNPKRNEQCLDFVLYTYNQTVGQDTFFNFNKENYMKTAPVKFQIKGLRVSNYSKPDDTSEAVDYTTPNGTRFALAKDLIGVQFCMGGRFWPPPFTTFPSMGIAVEYLRAATASAVEFFDKTGIELYKEEEEREKVG